MWWIKLIVDCWDGNPWIASLFRELVHVSPKGQCCFWCKQDVRRSPYVVACRIYFFPKRSFQKSMKSTCHNFSPHAWSSVFTEWIIFTFQKRETWSLSQLQKFQLNRSQWSGHWCNAGKSGRRVTGNKIQQTAMWCDQKIHLMTRGWWDGAEQRRWDPGGLMGVEKQQRGVDDLKLELSMFLLLGCGLVSV